MDVQVRALSFSRGARSIFDKLSLSVPQGSVVSIMGPSGCGKTTLLHMILGSLQPDQGEVSIAGQVLSHLKRSELYRLRQSIGMLFQNGALFTHLSVYENVAFPLREHTGLAESHIRDLVLLRLHWVGLRGAAYLMPSQLSGGMARRVALARALALDPRLMIYDEPFTGLDPMTKGVIVSLIRRLHEALGSTTILVSHDVRETLDIADYVYILSGGCIVGEGRPADLINSENPFVSQFLKGLPDGVVPFHYACSATLQEDLARVVR